MDLQHIAEANNSLGTRSPADGDSSPDAPAAATPTADGISGGSAAPLAGAPASADEGLHTGEGVPPVAKSFGQALWHLPEHVPMGAGQQVSPSATAAWWPGLCAPVLM